jgi:hypothetical protein
MRQPTPDLKYYGVINWECITVNNGDHFPMPTWLPKFTFVKSLMNWKTLAGGIDAIESNAPLF